MVPRMRRPLLTCLFPQSTGGNRRKTMPYTKQDYLRHIPMLMPRETVHTYQVIVEIAACLQEKVDFRLVDSTFGQYGFDLGKYAVTY